MMLLNVIPCAGYYHDIESIPSRCSQMVAYTIFNLYRDTEEKILNGIDVSTSSRRLSNKSLKRIYLFSKPSRSELSSRKTDLKFSYLKIQSCLSYNYKPLGWSSVLNY